jgi:hypothetical protein
MDHSQINRNIIYTACLTTIRQPLLQQYATSNTHYICLTVSWPAGHTCPTNKEFFQVRWDNSNPLFLHAAIYLEVSLFRWTSQNAFFTRNSTVQMILCAMLHSSIAHRSFVHRCFAWKMYSDWFNELEILQGRWSMEKKWVTVIPADLKRLFVSGTYMSRWSRNG